MRLGMPTTIRYSPTKKELAQSLSMVWRLLLRRPVVVGILGVLIVAEALILRTWWVAATVTISAAASLLAGRLFAGSQFRKRGGEVIELTFDDRGLVAATDKARTA